MTAALIWRQCTAQISQLNKSSNKEHCICKAVHGAFASRAAFCLPCKGRWASKASRRDFLKKIDFKKKVLRCLIPQSSSMTAPFTREPNKGSKLYLSIACATAGFQHTVQIFTNTVEVAVYLIIGNSYNRKSVLFKKFCPFGVIFNSFILVVL